MSKENVRQLAGYFFGSNVILLLLRTELASTGVSLAIHMSASIATRSASPRIFGARNLCSQMQELLKMLAMSDETA